MLITILTEGSIDWGIGHICRCLAFYDAFLNEGFDVRFIIHGDTSVTSLLSNRNVEYIPWLEDIALLKNALKMKWYLWILFKRISQWLIFYRIMFIN